MPSKTAQLIAFLSVFLVSAGLHRFVYANLKRVLLRDYPRSSKRLVRIAWVVFVVMDGPFLFIFLRPHLHLELSTLTKALIYPFSVWQAIMILWAVILVPFAAWRRGRAGARHVGERIQAAKSKKVESASEEELAGYGEEDLGIATE